MNKKVITWIFFAIIILVVVGIVIKNWDWIKGIFSGGKNTKCSDADSPYECMKKMGAVYFKTTTGEEGVSFGDYQFYSNNRAFKVSTKAKGSYNKDAITWDGRGTTTIKEVFKTK